MIKSIIHNWIRNWIRHQLFSGSNHMEIMDIIALEAKQVWHEDNDATVRAQLIESLNLSLDKVQWVQGPGEWKLKNA